MFREKIIKEIVEGKDVLDIGSVGQSDEYLLWGVLQESARSLTGVDLPEAPQIAESEFGVNTSHSENASIVYGNMEKVDLGRQFDVVTAGDVIEHVNNQGLFLSNIRRHLKPDGKLVITTPNAKWPTVFLKPNHTHTLWHDIHTLRTQLKRCGFEIEKFYYYFGNKPNYALVVRPLVWRQSILAICRKSDG